MDQLPEKRQAASERGDLQRFDDAATSFRARLFKRLAVHALSVGDAEGALFAAGESLKLDDEAGAKHLRALALAVLGHLEQAESSQIQAEQSGLPEVMIHSAWELFGDHWAGRGKKDNALRCYRHAADNPAGRGSAALKAAALLLDRARIDEARKMALDAAEAAHEAKRPDVALNILRLAESMFEAHDLDATDFLPLMSDFEQEASSTEFLQASFERLDARDEEDPQAWYALGCSLDAAGADDHAMLAYRRALTLAPDHAKSWVNLGYVFQKRDQKAKARRAWELALSINPGLPEVHQNLGMLAVGEGEAEKGEAHFREAIRLREEFAPAWHELGNLYMEADKPREAAQSFRQAVKFERGATSSWISLGLALFLSDDLDGAARAADRAGRLMADAVAQEWNNLGVLYSNLDRKDEARSAWEKALELDPSLDEPRTNIDDLDQPE